MARARARARYGAQAQATHRVQALDVADVLVDGKMHVVGHAGGQEAAAEAYLGGSSIE